MKIAVAMIFFVCVARADRLVSPLRPESVTPRHDDTGTGTDARYKKRAGTVMLGVGLALTVVGAVLLGDVLYTADHAPPSDSAGPALNYFGLTCGSSFVLQSGVAILTAGATLYGVGAARERKQTRVAWMPNGFRF